MQMHLYVLLQLLELAAALKYSKLELKKQRLGGLHSSAQEVLTVVLVVNPRCIAAVKHC
jgi:hypothetical protein